MPHANRPSPKKAAQMIAAAYEPITTQMEQLLDRVLDVELGPDEDRAMDCLYDAIEKMAELNAIVNAKFPGQLRAVRPGPSRRR